MGIVQRKRAKSKDKIELNVVSDMINKYEDEYQPPVANPVKKRK